LERTTLAALDGSKESIVMVAPRARGAEVQLVKKLVESKEFVSTPYASAQRVVESAENETIVDETIY
jgi:hypothetical protein